MDYTRPSGGGGQPWRPLSRREAGTMASFRESSSLQQQQPETTTMDEEDIRGDGKKKKFKPLSAVRKLFGKKRKKDDTVVAVKAQSTTALHSGYAGEEDDDDGGFKNHQKPVALAGARSISEDSIFSPEPKKETRIGDFPKSAVSEESLPKSQFQNELFSKLQKRRSQYSDDDHDDGLPKSPVPPVTTADVMGGPLKPVSSDKKTSNRDSDQSLISVDSSENEEDNLWITNWKSSIPSVKQSSGKQTSPTKGKMDLDFNKIEKTDLLRSSAAKDRISVKPQGRRSSRKSVKIRDNASPQSLPSLNEESPTRSLSEDKKKSPNSGSRTEATAASNENKTVHIQPASSAAPADTSTNKPKVSSITITSQSSSHSVGSLAEEKTGNAKVTSPVSPSSKVLGFPQKNISSSSSSPKHVAATISGTPSSQTVTTKVSSNISAESVNEKNNETNVQAEREGGSIKSRAGIFNQTDSDQIKGSVDIRSRMSQFQSGSPVKTTKTDTPALKVSDPDSNITLSPKEDYKLKRQSRARTLPGGIDDQTSEPGSETNSPKVQRANSQRIPGSLSQVSTETDSEVKGSSGVRKFDTSRFGNVSSASSSSSSSSTSSQPSWLDKVKKRTEEQEKLKEETKESVPESVTKQDQVKTESVTSRFGGVSSAPKAVFSSNFAEKKHNVEITPVKEKESNEQSGKTESKRPSIDIGSTKRESIEIDIAELSPVKSLGSSFGSSKVSSVRDQNKFGSNVASSANSSSTSPVSLAERAKLFSVGSNVNTAKASDSSDNKTANKPPSGGGIGHFRGGSVKTSPTKTVDVKSSFPARAGSVKTSAFKAPSSPTKSSSNSDTNKTSEPSSPAKTDTKGISSTTSSAPTTATHAPKFNPSSSHASSNVHSVTPISSTASASNPKPLSSITPSPFSSSIRSKTSPINSTPGSSLNNFSASTTAINVKSSSAFGSGVTSSIASVNVTTASVTSTSSSNTSSSSTSSSSPFSGPRSNPIRAHASFSAASSTKPINITTSPASRSSASFKSPSLKPATTGTSSVTSSSSSSSSSSNNSTEKKEAEKPSTGKVPAWRANLHKKDVQIEIIENTSSSSQSSQTKSENVKKGPSSAKIAEPSKNTEPQADKASHRSSKVLDMVKNFQNLQVSS